MSEKEDQSKNDEMHEEHPIPESDVPKGKKSGKIFGDPIICFST